jgi:MtN3 and saliva related transmembrane protein
MGETALGLIAATLTTSAFVPQVFKAWRTKRTRDISGPTFLVLFVGIVLWMVYGALKADPVIIAANATTEVLVISILVLKRMHDDRLDE